MVAKQNIEEKVLTIKWLMSEDKIIKFIESDKTYDISEKVAEFDFIKSGIDKGSKVSVKIDLSQGDNGTLVFMTKFKENAQEEPTTTSEAKANTLTVEGISIKTKAMTFKEQEGVWYTIPDSVGIFNLKTWGIEKGIQVEIKSEPQTKGNAIITFIKKVGGQSQNSYKGNNQTKYYNPEQTSSIEAQGAVQRAFALAEVVFGNKENVNKADVKSFISEFSEFAYKEVQTLKQSQQ